jgi:translation initiation factor 2 beta subunit (eIF-2beta)/eIF-5
MRQWLVDPKKMCKRHLLGEHVEHHMFISILLKKKNIKGYIENDLIEPLSLQQRHDELVEEMISRGYSHNSPLNFNKSILEYLPVEYINHKINRQNSERLLFLRCNQCGKKHLSIKFF